MLQACQPLHSDKNKIYYKKVFPQYTFYSALDYILHKT